MVRGKKVEWDYSHLYVHIYLQAQLTPGRFMTPMAISVSHCQWHLDHTDAFWRQLADTTEAIFCKLRSSHTTHYEVNGI
jgi:hypothetical protein